jgi:hypothetical protein
MIENKEIRYLIYGIIILYYAIFIKEILLADETFLEWFNNAAGFIN